MPLSQPPVEEVEDDANENDFMEEYTAQCISSRIARAPPGIEAGSVVRLNRPTASGTYTVYIDSIHGDSVQYSYGLGLLSEGMCLLSDIRGLEENHAP